MGSEFWRTIRLAIERDTWTARLVVLCLAAGVFWACVRVTTAGWPSASPGEAPPRAGLVGARSVRWAVAGGA